MALQPEVTDEYVKHALQLIRVANGLRADASALVRQMAQKIRLLLLGENLTELSFPALKRIVNEADSIAFEVFNQLEEQQISAVEDLIRNEVEWATRTGDYERAVSEAKILEQVKTFTTVGETISEQFDRIASNFHANVLQQVRQGADANQTDRQIVARIVGQGPLMSGGIGERTLRDVTGTIDAQVQAAADAGRRLAMAQNGVNAIQWHAVLDPLVCPSCGERADKFWTIDGKPIAHDIPFMPIPAHPWCRCIYLPQQIPENMLDKIKPTNTFQKFLNSLTQAQQEDVLGVGRTQLWRDGKITLSDLIGQNGLVMTLKELKNSLE
jgi:hypothetical protein